METDRVEIRVVVRRRPGVYRIGVAGEIDQVGALRLRRELDAAVAEHPERIEVDLGDATFFCCAAVTALMQARQASGGRLALVGASRVVRKFLELAGLTTTLPDSGQPLPDSGQPLPDSGQPPPA
jgi:anti-anti-sigma factor